ncbi:MAG TPA: XdhC family protein [Vicinamibacterales bacterium]|nr:XdhC family protein [Vicinamibacterales bacterium]
MRPDILQLAADLARKGEPFVMAVVVRREPASSAQVGNASIITEAGECHGWLGGSCIQATVVREALRALESSAPRLISLSPDPYADGRSGVTAFPMTCHSGGSVDIYLDPVLPAARLMVFGVSPAAQALARLGKVMGYAVDVIDPDADRDAFPDADRIVDHINKEGIEGARPFPRSRLFAVVATLGQHDEEATKEALALEPVYLGVIASRKRFSQIRETLVAGGVPSAALDRIANPAGLDIGARAPEEVALSILAEIVQVRRHAAEGQPQAVAESASIEARDPVCGMDVAVATAKHRAEHAGRTYYFCCGGCRERFVASPDRYAGAVVS